MDGCALTVISGWCGTHFPDSPATAAGGSRGAPPATFTIPSGAGRLVKTTPRQPTGGVETAGLFPSQVSNWTTTTRPCSSDRTCVGHATARAGTAGCEAQCLLAYHALLDQMDGSPVRARIARKLEQLADSALEGSWQKELKKKWRAAQSSCAS